MKKGCLARPWIAGEGFEPVTFGLWGTLRCAFLDRTLVSATLIGRNSKVSEWILDGAGQPKRDRLRRRILIHDGRTLHDTIKSKVRTTFVARNNHDPAQSLCLLSTGIPVREPTGLFLPFFFASHRFRFGSCGHTLLYAVQSMLPGSRVEQDCSDSVDMDLGFFCPLHGESGMCAVEQILRF